MENDGLKGTFEAFESYEKQQLESMHYTNDKVRGKLKEQTDNSETLKK